MENKIEVGDFEKQGQKMLFFNVLTHEGSHREIYRDFQPSYDIFRRSGSKRYLNHRLRAPLAYTAQLLTLHQHRANN